MCVCVHAQAPASTRPARQTRATKAAAKKRRREDPPTGNAGKQEAGEDESSEGEEVVDLTSLPSGKKSGVPTPGARRSKPVESEQDDSASESGSEFEPSGEEGDDE